MERYTRQSALLPVSLMETFSSKSFFTPEERAKKKEESSGSLLLWGAIIFSLLGLNAFSWVFCMNVFGHPEDPFNYKLLTHPKIDRLDPIHGFSPVTAPRGNFYSAKELYVHQYEFSGSQLESYNALLKRRYLHNYENLSDVIYFQGNIVIETVHVLGPQDVFPSGLAIRGQSDDFPATTIEYILPAESLPPAHFEAGELLEVEHYNTCAALLNIRRLNDDRVCFSVVPLVERKMETTAGSVVSVSPPERLNIEGSWPITGTSVIAANEPLVATPIKESVASTGGEAAE